MEMNVQRAEDEACERLQGGNGSKGALIGLVACISVPILILTAITLTIPILDIIIGALYLNECPIDNRIPIFLLVSGIVTVAGILCMVIMVFIEQFFFHSNFGSKLETRCISDCQCNAPEEIEECHSDYTNSNHVCYASYFSVCRGTVPIRLAHSCILFLFFDSSTITVLFLLILYF